MTLQTPGLEDVVKPLLTTRQNLILYDPANISPLVGLPIN